MRIMQTPRSSALPMCCCPTQTWMSSEVPATAPPVQPPAAESPSGGGLSEEWTRHVFPAYLSQMPRRHPKLGATAAATVGPHDTAVKPASVTPEPHARNASAVVLPPPRKHAPSPQAVQQLRTDLSFTEARSMIVEKNADSPGSRRHREIVAELQQRLTQLQSEHADCERHIAERHEAATKRNVQAARAKFHETTWRNESRLATDEDRQRVHSFVADNELRCDVATFLRSMRQAPKR